MKTLTKAMIFSRIGMVLEILLATLLLLKKEFLLAFIVGFIMMSQGITERILKRIVRAKIDDN